MASQTIDVLACVLSYRMRERTDTTVSQMVAHGFTLGENLFVFENSPRGHFNDVAKSVTHYTGDNLRMTGGFNFICDWVSDNFRPAVVWLCTNDFDIKEVRGGKSLPATIRGAFASDPSIGWWHPSKTVEPGYAYPWMHNIPGSDQIRRVKMTDFICPAIWWNILLYLREKNGYWFDPSFYRGWGIDYDTCHQIRRNAMHVGVGDSVLIDHKSSATYLMGVAPETKDEFYDKAHKEMWDRLRSKYGANWHKEIG